MAPTPKPLSHALFDMEELRTRLRARLAELVSELFGDVPDETPTHYRLGSIEGDPGSSTAISRLPGKQGVWLDHNPQARHRSGDILDMIAHAKGMRVGEAIAWAAGWTGLAEPTQHRLKPAGADQLKRKTAALWQPANAPALAYLRGRGLADETLRRFHIGVSARYESPKDGKIVERAICYPLIGSDGLPRRRFYYYEVPGFTVNARSKGWGAGAPETYYAAARRGQTALIVCEGAKDLWWLTQALGEERALVITSTHGSGVPDEWKSPAFWSEFERVYLAQDSDEAGDAMARAVARCAARDVYRLRAPTQIGKDWTDFFRSGGSADGARQRT